MKFLRGGPEKFCWFYIFFSLILKSVVDSLLRLWEGWVRPGRGNGGGEWVHIGLEEGRGGESILSAGGSLKNKTAK